jgi:hypothetical protein
MFQIGDLQISRPVSLKYLVPKFLEKATEGDLLANKNSYVIVGFFGHSHGRLV